MTLTSLPNGESYASVAEADARLATDPVRKDAWAALSDPEKEDNLVASTNRLDLLNWEGEKTGGATQANEWFREGATYDDGTEVPNNVIPLGVENGCSVLAGTITLNPTFADQGTSGSNVKKVEAGSAKVTFFRSTFPGGVIQDETVLKLVGEFLEGGITKLALTSGVSDATVTGQTFPRSDGFA